MKVWRRKGGLGLPVNNELVVAAVQVATAFIEVTWEWNGADPVVWRYLYQINGGAWNDSTVAGTFRIAQIENGYTPGTEFNIKVQGEDEESTIIIGPAFAPLLVWE